MSPSKESLSNLQAFLIAGMLILIASTYSRTLGFEFVWDDAVFIESERFSQPLSKGILSTQHDLIDEDFGRLKNRKQAHESYRPVMFASTWLDLRLFGPSPAAMHAHNVALALLAVTMFFLVAWVWLMDFSAALVASAVFAFHPLLVEPISYVSARSDLLAGLFALASVVLALVYQSRKDGSFSLKSLLTFGACVCFALSLFSKEAYLGLPFVIATMLFLRGHRTEYPVVIALFVTLAAFLWVRIRIGGSAGVQSIQDAVLILPALWQQYASVFILPWALSTERMFDDVFLLSGFVLLALLLLLGIVGLLRASGERAVCTKTFIVGLVWSVVLLGPSAIIVHQTRALADRYAFLPIAGLALTFGGWWLYMRDRRGKRLMLAGTTAFLALLYFQTWNQISVWANNRSLYTHAVRTEPSSSMAHYRLSTVSSGVDPVSERRLLLAASRLDPMNYRALNNLGANFMVAGELDEAVYFLTLALNASQEKHYRAWYNLAATRLRQNQPIQACELLAKALAINPVYSQAENLWAQLSCEEMSH